MMMMDGHSESTLEKDRKFWYVAVSRDGNITLPASSTLYTKYETAEAVRENADMAFGDEHIHFVILCTHTMFFGWKLNTD